MSTRGAQKRQVESPAAAQPANKKAKKNGAAAGGAEPEQAPIDAALSLLRRRILRDVSDVDLTSEQETKRRCAVRALQFPPYKRHLAVSSRNYYRALEAARYTTTCSKQSGTGTQTTAGADGPAARRAEHKPAHAAHIVREHMERK